MSHVIPDQKPTSSRSRRRRMRATLTKQKLWSERMLYSASSAWPGFVMPPPFTYVHWQPEAEISPGEAQIIQYSGNTSEVPEVSSCPDTRLPDLQLLCNSLEHLSDSLSAKLYSSARPLQQAVSHVLQLEADFQPYTVPFPAVVDDFSYQVPQCDCYELHLEHTRTQHVALLGKLGHAAEFFATNMEAFDSVEVALESYWSLFDPVGIQQRQEENRLFEDELDGGEENGLGHMFTYDRAQFWQRTQAVSPELRREFVQFGLSHPPRTWSHLWTWGELESMYFGCDQRAFAWQEEYEDDDDTTSELLALIRLLRRAVRGEP